MKVLYLINSLKPYGAEKSIVQIVQNFTKVQPSFVILSKIESDLRNLLEVKNIPYYQLDINKKESNKKVLNRIFPILKSEKPDILHTMLFQSDMVGRKLKKIFPELILVGSLVNNSYSKFRYSNLGYLDKLKLFSTQLRDRSSVNKVDYFISNSEAIIDPNVQALAIQKEIIKVIHRGREINIKHLEPLDESLIQLISNKTIFLNVGRLSLNKGQLDLVEAFKNISSKRNDLCLLIAGEGDLRQELEEKIKLYNLEHVVHLLGYRKDVINLLQHADYCIFSSYVEGLSGAIIEAILSQKPCIVSNIDENMECFPDDKSALFFPVGNVQRIISCIEEALNLSEDQWRKKISKSYEYGRKHFELVECSRKYEEFYKEISNR